jgi:glycosyltransferase involved in cell wall biosynthesis
MPKVSVIIPTYNRARLVAEAIQSVLDQTYQDFEIIVIDDGSTDNTKEVVGSFKDPRIKYFYQENRGVCIARNNGIKVSNGDYIIFLDSDDLLFKNAIAIEAKILDSYPDVALIYSQLYTIDEKERVIGLRKPKNRQPGIWQGTREIANLLINGNYICPSQALVRRSSIIDVGLFDPAFSSGSEDFELWVRIAKKYAVSYIAEPVGKYRFYPSGISAGRDMDEIEKSHRRILDGIFNDAQLGPLFSPHRSRAYFHLHLRFASYAYAERKMKVSRKYLFKALQIHPHAVIENIFFPWVYLFAKTWIPMPILRVIHRIRRHRFSSGSVGF